MDADRTAHRLKALSAATQAVYERQAETYDRQRSQDMFERDWLLRALQDVPAGGAVLDLGCGAGSPIGVWLAGQGVALTGADFSNEMLRLFSDRLPDATAIYADMRHLSLGTKFHAIIGWGSFFHLTCAEQRAALPKIASHLAPAGRLLLTVGPSHGEVTGQVGTEAVYHASLSNDEYRHILKQVGAPVEIIANEDPACRGFTLLLARAEV